ncbi:hypothetical protein QF037_000755 [Streptomyces canus]|nr:hypothetical protein [Streptomyces canus]
MSVVDLHPRLEAVSAAPGQSGLAEVELRPVSVGAEAQPLRASGKTVAVVGADFRYRAITNRGRPNLTPTQSCRERLEKWPPATSGHRLPGPGSGTGRFAPAQDITFPAQTSGYTGHHTLFVIWQASHLDQAYMWCSDVNFG